MELVSPATHVRGFLDFIREQGVVGLAVGFILGGAISRVVSSFVADIINPILGIFLGSKNGLAQESFMIVGQKIVWGNFLSTIIDFLVMAAVVYFGLRIIGLNKLDKKVE